MVNYPEFDRAVLFLKSHLLI